MRTLALKSKWGFFSKVLGFALGATVLLGIVRQHQTSQQISLRKGVFQETLVELERLPIERLRDSGPPSSLDQLDPWFEVSKPPFPSVSDSMNPHDSAVLRAIKLFSNEKEIRVIVNGGGGMGHQRATLGVMVRLHELGFRGKYHILCMPTAESRFKTLLEAHNRCFRRFPSERVTFEQSDLDENKHLPRIRFGITGANDLDAIATSDKYATEVLIAMQPTDWFGRYSVSKGDEKFYFDESPVAWDHQSYKGIELDVLENSLEKGPRKEYLVKVIQEMLAGNLDVQIVYGLHPWRTDLERQIKAEEIFRRIGGMLALWPGPQAMNEDSPTSLGEYPATHVGLDPKEELTLLMGGYQRVQSVLERPVIVLILSDVANSELPNVAEREFSRVGNMSVIFDQFSEHAAGLTLLKRGSVQLVNLGPQPQPVFDMLLERTSFPPLVEGANAQGIAKASRGDLMLGGRSYLKEDPAQEAASKSYPKQHQIFIDSQIALCSALNLSKSEIGVAAREESIARFLRASYTGGMAPYFESWRRSTLRRPDALLSLVGILLSEPQFGEAL